MKGKKFRPDNLSEFRIKSIHWANKFPVCSYLNNNNISFPDGGFPNILAAGAESFVTDAEDSSFSRLKSFHENNKDWLFGYFSYDLKNEIEDLTSTNEDRLGFPEMYFYKPLHRIHFYQTEVEIFSADEANIYEEIINTPIPSPARHSVQIRQKFSRVEYLQKIEKIKSFLEEGEIYEMNFCMEFFAEHADIDPLRLYLDLNTISPMPFSVFHKIDERFLICASPERFLKKSGTRLLSQPMKGTAPRGTTPAEDDTFRTQLSKSSKEISENMMIVDLVRNDLAKSAIPGTVKAEELFSVYTFRQAHQMISSISAEMKEGLHFTEAIQNAFPMGSMTGAPKIRAMQLIEDLESTKRGLFSGAFGYISPDGDFDLNVIIRSALYNSKNKYLSFQAGSAITYECEAENEYEECLLKASPVSKVLSNC